MAPPNVTKLSADVKNLIGVGFCWERCGVLICSKPRFASAKNRFPYFVVHFNPQLGYNINLNATAEVNGFEEEQRGPRFEVEIVKTPAPKK